MSFTLTFIKNNIVYFYKSCLFDNLLCLIDFCKLQLIYNIK